MTTEAAEILLVDDSIDDRAITLRAFKKAGYEAAVRTAESGIEALELLGVEPEDPHRERPQVVFLDLRMPILDGVEVLERIRRHPSTARLPVVIISSSNRPEDIERSYDAGANGYIVKNLDPKSPGRRIAEAARYWVELNHISRRATVTRSAAIPERKPHE